MRKRIAARALALVAATVSLSLLIGSASALALQTHVLLGQTPAPGTEGNVTGVGVNNATGHFYLRSGGSVYNFGPDGRLDAVQPRLTGGPSYQPFSVALDNSTGATVGTVWVGSIQESEVVQYSSAGVATGLTLNAGSLPADGTPQGAGLPPVANTGPIKPRGVAIDTAGNLYVLDLGAAQAIDKFSPGGTFLAQYAQASIPTGANGITVGSAGGIWVSSISGLIELDASGQCVEAGCAPTVSGFFTGVAADRSNQTILALVQDTSQTGHLAEYDEAGQLLGESGGEVLNEPNAIAVDESTGLESSGRVYVTDLATRSFLTFGPTTLLPDATTEPATNVGSGEATFHGQVSAAGGPSATCLFQYVDEATFQAGRFAGASSIPCTPAGPFSGESVSSVSALATGLNGGTTYHYRLLATSASGSSPGADLTFTTGGPSVLSQSASAISETGASLQATINPNGVQTSYLFELVTESQFQQSGFDGAVRLPIAPLPLGGGSASVPVTQPITGLSPATPYRYRVVATDVTGAVSRGPASTFATFAAAASSLPDGRAYEQASPTEKNANDAWGEVNAVKAAAGGNAITFYSTAGIPGGTGGQTYGEYQANRASDGSRWTTEGLLPEAGAGYFARIMGWSEELNLSYPMAKRTGEPPVLYSRQQGGSLGPIAVGTGSVAPQQYIAAATPSGSQVYFESAPGGKTKPGAYLWDEQAETVTLVGVTNEGKAIANGSLAGPYEWFSNAPDTTKGGAGAEYYTQAANALSIGGNRAFFTQAGTGQLYVRENPLLPQSPVDSEGNCTDTALACTVRISAPAPGVTDPEQPAAFLGATPGGNQVYFLSAGKFTADSTATGGHPDLYRYDLYSRQLTDLTVDSTPGDSNGSDVQGILGTVGDGSRIYFVANGRLAPNTAPGTCSPTSVTGECNLYSLSGGQIDFVARLSAGATASPEKTGGELGDERDWAPTSRFNGLGGGSGSRENTSRTAINGQVLLFRSANQLTSYRNEGVPELYLARTGAPLLCLSCSPTNAAPKGAAGLQNILPRGLGAPGLAFGTLTRNLSNSGTRVIFDTPDALVSADTNGVNDVYEWEMSGTGSCQGSAQNGGCLYLLSTGKSPSPSFFADASTNGDDAFFFTQQPLVAQDHDELYDVYDARVGGGIPSQNQPERRICSGEECAAPVGAAPSEPSVGSNAAQAPNPKAKVCKKGFKRRIKHGRETCVRVKKHKGKPSRHKKHAKRHKGRTQASHGKGGSK